MERINMGQLDNKYHRSVLRSLRPGMQYVVYSDNENAVKSIASATNQFNRGESHIYNIWFHHRKYLVKLKSGREIYRIELVTCTRDEHISGKDKDWKDKTYTYGDK